MKSNPAGYSSNARWPARFSGCSQAATARACRSRPVVGQADFLRFAIDQIGESAILALVGSTMPQQIHQIRGTEKRTRQIIEMHGYPNSLGEKEGTGTRLAARQTLYLPSSVRAAIGQDIVFASCAGSSREREFSIRHRHIRQPKPFSRYKIPDIAVPIKRLENDPQFPISPKNLH